MIVMLVLSQSSFGLDHIGSEYVGSTRSPMVSSSIMMNDNGPVIDLISMEITSCTKLNDPGVAFLSSGSVSHRCVSVLERIPVPTPLYPGG